MNHACCMSCFDVTFLKETDRFKFPFFVPLYAITVFTHMTCLTGQFLDPISFLLPDEMPSSDNKNQYIDQPLRRLMICATRSLVGSKAVLSTFSVGGTNGFPFEAAIINYCCSANRTIPRRCAGYLQSTVEDFRV